MPPARLLAAIELDPKSLLDLDGRVPAASAVRAWRVAAEQSGDPYFGLSVVEHLRPDDMGFLGFAMQSSATVGDGLRRLARFFHIVNQLASLTLVEDGALVRARVVIEHDVDADELRHPIECLLAALPLDVPARARGGARVPPCVQASRRAQRASYRSRAAPRGPKG